MNNKIIRLGIIGTGNAALLHLKAFQSREDVRIAGIVGRNKDKAHMIARQFDIEWCPTSSKEMINSDEIDAVVIAVPPFVQPDLAVQAFRRGKHVLCEKPLGVSLNDVTRVYEVWKESARVGMINFCYRFIPEILEFKARIAAGDCGHVHSIHAEWILSSRLNPSLTFHWKGQSEFGGGVLQNFGVHMLDYLFFDIPNIKVSGAKQDIFVTARQDKDGNMREVSGDEVTTALLDIGNGAAAVINLSLVTVPPVGHRVIARGSKGTMEVRNLNTASQAGPFSLWLFDDSLEQGKCLSEGKKNESDMALLFARVDKQFIEAIQNADLNCQPTIEQGLKASKLLHEIKAVAGCTHAAR